MGESKWIVWVKCPGCGRENLGDPGETEVHSKDCPVAFKPKPTVDDEHVKRSVRKINGQWSIEVSHCLHCGRLCLAPTSDNCVCGAEMYPVSKRVPLGEPVLVNDMKGA